jgi:hypothetical protein
MLDAPPPHPPSSSGAETSGHAFSCSTKLPGNHQHQIKHTQLLAVVENSRAPVNNAHVQKNMAPVTSSSINCATCYNQRSRVSTKKLLKQAVANISKE